jgi:hypothetical protein
LLGASGSSFPVLAVLRIDAPGMVSEQSLLAVEQSVASRQRPRIS